jgi:hypothetical protein
LKRERKTLRKAMEKKASFRPLVTGSLILAVSQVLTFFLAFREKDFLETSQITLPEISVEWPLVYFFGAVVVVGLIISLIPLTALRWVLKILFLFLFVWGAFIALSFSLPVPAAAALGSIHCPELFSARTGSRRYFGGCSVTVALYTQDLAAQSADGYYSGQYRDGLRCAFCPVDCYLVYVGHLSV